MDIAVQQAVSTLENSVSNLPRSQRIYWPLGGALVELSWAGFCVNVVCFRRCGMVQVSECLRAFHFMSQIGLVLESITYEDSSSIK